MSNYLESPQYLVLLALADGEKAGSEVQRQIIGDTVGHYLPTNTVYRTLRGLEETGLVSMVIWRTQKIYRMTDKGRHFLDIAAKEKRETSRLARQRLGIL